MLYEGLTGLIGRYKEGDDNSRDEIWAEFFDDVIRAFYVAIDKNDTWWESRLKAREEYLRNSQESEGSSKTPTNTESRAIALCGKLVNWMIQQKPDFEVSFGLAMLLKEAQEIAQQADIS